MKTEILKAAYPNALNHAVDVLKNGGLVAFPTDTVYGLAALPTTEEYVERLFAAKGRNNSRAIAILIGNYSDLNKVVNHLDEMPERLAHRFWPGPLTIVVPKIAGLPETLSQDGTIGVRMPDHPVALALLRQIGPLAVTSANISGKDNTNSAEEVYRQLNGRVHLILDGGRSAGGVPSTVVSCISADMKILREGPISLEEIEAALA
ncbi:MAG: L-threonylcarbamoyladenylate synthase [Anaerolineales bacterium]